MENETPQSLATPRLTPFYPATAPSHVSPPPPTRDNFARGCIFVFLGLFVLSLIGIAGCLALVIGIATHHSSAIVSEAPQVLVLDLRGMISLEPEPSFFSETEGSSATALRLIREAENDCNIRGILLRIDSGGGEITASDVIWKALRDFKEADTNRLVVALMGNIAASGAYYVSCAADKIVAHPTTLTGSIGVKISSYNVKTLADKLGIVDATIASGGNKDILNPMKEMTPEQEAMLQKMVDELHSIFVKRVVDGRGLSEAKVRAVADGRVMLSSEALDANLVDKIGYEADARRLFCEHFGEHVEFAEQRAGKWDFLRSPGFFGEAAAKAVEASAKQNEGIVIK